MGSLKQMLTLFTLLDLSTIDLGEAFFKTLFEPHPFNAGYVWHKLFLFELE